MKKQNLIVFCHLNLLLFTDTVLSDNTCEGGWEPYKDEKCLKIFDTAELVSYEEAESYCKQKYDANLVSVAFADKQTFLENFLKTKEIADYIWIGLKYAGGENYDWSDNSNFYYTNWASGSPKYDPDYCVQINTDDAEFGKWVEVLCTKKNLILCEKVQPWSLSQLQNEFMNLKKNLMPIGFTYVQLPKEVPPANIWPWMTWKDVSSDYAGVFFRVEGGNAASFGDIQGEDSPRLIESYISKNPDGFTYTNSNPIPADGQRHFAFWGALGNFGDGFIIQNLTVSAAEVRPRNMAVRIWKRTQ